MPKHKTLQGVVNSFAESFLGPLNYVNDDFVMAHLAEAAWRSGKSKLIVNLVTGTAEPAELLVPAVKTGVDAYVRLFPDMVHRSNSDMSFVSEATLSIELQPAIYTRGLMSGLIGSPYRCHVRVVDDRGRVYECTRTGAAAPERRVPSPVSTFFRRLIGKSS